MLELTWDLNRLLQKIESGFERSLDIARDYLDDDDVPPYVKIQAMKMFTGLVATRLSDSNPTREVTPQEKFMSLMSQIRDVPPARTLVTDDDIIDVPVDEEPDAGSRAASS